MQKNHSNERFAPAGEKKAPGTGLKSKGLRKTGGHATIRVLKERGNPPWEEAKGTVVQSNQENVLTNIRGRQLLVGRDER